MNRKRDPTLSATVAGLRLIFRAPGMTVCAVQRHCDKKSQREEKVSQVMLDKEIRENSKRNHNELALDYLKIPFSQSQTFSSRFVEEVDVPFVLLVVLDVALVSRMNTK
jgi:hypothetical protein